MLLGVILCYSWNVYNLVAHHFKYGTIKTCVTFIFLFENARIIVVFVTKLYKIFFFLYVLFYGILVQQSNIRCYHLIESEFLHVEKTFKQQ